MTVSRRHPILKFRFCQVKLYEPNLESLKWRQRILRPYLIFRVPTAELGKSPVTVQREARKIRELLRIEIAGIGIGDYCHGWAAGKASHPSLNGLLWIAGRKVAL